MKDQSDSLHIVELSKVNELPAAITDTGCERRINEDRYAYLETPSGSLWIVCDGMGGVSGGDLAAQLAIDSMRRELENNPRREVVFAIENAILDANRLIVLRRQNKAFAEMGTTVVAALFAGNELAIAHVGDSRAYLIRGRKLEQITQDHTFVQELVNSGKITYEAALTHPQAHVLTRALGSEPSLKVDVDKFWIWENELFEQHDRLILCSDGLYSHVTDDEICKIVAEKSAQRACADLVELAKSRGGFDNITVCVIPIQGQLRREPNLADQAKHKKRKPILSTGIFIEEETLWDILFKEFIISFIISLFLIMLVFLFVGFKLLG
jgi:serine/threonine protein phosphatase PrpC